VERGVLRRGLEEGKSLALGISLRRAEDVIADLGCTPMTGSPAAFGSFVADDPEKWGKVIKFASIRLE
jgi:hypothetical protein